jgi:hypothetical protein
MKCKLNITAGGIFSKYIFGIKNAILHESDSYYLNIVDPRADPDMFDCVMDQSLDIELSLNPVNKHLKSPTVTYSDYKEVDCIHLGNYSKFNPIEDSPNLPKYSEIINKFKLKKELLDKVEYYQNKFNIDENTVGVHIRLTDMNIYHGSDYGVLSFEDFKSHLKPDVKYFVASDNYESLKKLKELFGNNVNYVDDLIRAEFENDDTSAMFLNNPVVFKNRQFWFESFLEMLLLSKCGSLICRSSDLNNVAVIYSKTIKNIIRL